MHKSVQLNPLDAEAQNNYGVTLQELGRLQEAEDCYIQAIDLEPNYIEAHNNLGNLFKDQNKYENAIDAYNKVISINPDNAEAYYNKGVTFKKLGKLEEAILMYTKALELNPQYADAYNNLGNALQDKGETEKAIHAYKKSFLFKSNFPNAHLNLSYALFNSGRIMEAFNEYELRWETSKFIPQKRNFKKPVWDGKHSLKDKIILLWSEQGIGDTIMWASKIASLRSQCKHCILECQEKLIPLLKRSLPNVEVKIQDRTLDTERDDFDFHLPMGSLYKNFVQELLINKKVDSYLVPDPIRVEYWQKRLKSLGNGPFIGSSWKSSNMSPHRIQNYSSIYDWLPILSISDVTFINLQNKDFADDLAKIKEKFGVTVHNFEDLDQFNDLLDVAALTTALDMVVSIKTTIPLISAGVGTLTKLANWKQSYWNNILHNPVGPLIDIYERNTWESWDNVFNSIAEDIVKFKKESS